MRKVINNQAKSKELTLVHVSESEFTPTKKMKWSGNVTISTWKDVDNNHTTILNGKVVDPNGIVFVAKDVEAIYTVNDPKTIVEAIIGRWLPTGKWSFRDLEFKSKCNFWDLKRLPSIREKKAIKLHVKGFIPVYKHGNELYNWWISTDYKGLMLGEADVEYDGVNGNVYLYDVTDLNIKKYDGRKMIKIKTIKVDINSIRGGVLLNSIGVRGTPESIPSDDSDISEYAESSFIWEELWA